MGKLKKNTTQFVHYDKMMFADVTVDWYITCKFNKIIALYIIRMIDLFQIKILLIYIIYGEN